MVIMAQSRMLVLTLLTVSLLCDSPTGYRERDGGNETAGLFQGTGARGESVTERTRCERMRCGAPSGTSYKACQVDGERQLAALARTAHIEDAWIYIARESLWVDVGTEEHETSVTLDFPRLREILQRHPSTGERLLLCHIHPLPVLSRSCIHPPIANDIYSGVVLKRILRQRYGATLVARVFDGRGVWTYDTSDELENSLRLPDYSRSPLLWPRYPEMAEGVTGGQLMMRRYTDFLVDFIALLEPITCDGHLNTEGRVAGYVDRARAMGVLLSYAPMRDGKSL